MHEGIGDPDLCSQLMEIMHYLPDLIDLTPEQEKDVNVLYAIAWKLFYGFDPPCAVPYVPNPVSEWPKDEELQEPRGKHEFSWTACAPMLIIERWPSLN